MFRNRSKEFQRGALILNIHEVVQQHAFLFGKGDILIHRPTEDPGPVAHHVAESFRGFFRCIQRFAGLLRFLCKELRERRHIPQFKFQSKGRGLQQAGLERGMGLPGSRRREKLPQVASVNGCHNFLKFKDLRSGKVHQFHGLHLFGQREHHFQFCLQQLHHFLCSSRITTGLLLHGPAHQHGQHLHHPLKLLLKFFNRSRGCERNAGGSRTVREQGLLDRIRRILSFLKACGGLRDNQNIPLHLCEHVHGSHCCLIGGGVLCIDFNQRKDGFRIVEDHGTPFSFRNPAQFGVLKHRPHTTGHLLDVHLRRNHRRHRANRIQETVKVGNGNGHQRVRNHCGSRNPHFSLRRGTGRFSGAILTTACKKKACACHQTRHA